MKSASEMTQAERTAHGAAILRQSHGDRARAEASALASWKGADDMRAHWKRVEALLRSEDAQRDTEPPGPPAAVSSCCRAAVMPAVLSGGPPQCSMCLGPVHPPHRIEAP